MILLNYRLVDRFNFYGVGRASETNTGLGGFLSTEDNWRFKEDSEKWSCTGEQQSPNNRILLFLVKFTEASPSQTVDGKD